MDLDNLRKIQRVEAPPFLFTRIKQKIEQTKVDTMPKVTALAMSLAFVFILVVNTVTLVYYPKEKSTHESFAKSMNITSNNALYNE